MEEASLELEGTSLEPELLLEEPSLLALVELVLFEDDGRVELLFCGAVLQAQSSRADSKVTAQIFFIRLTSFCFNKGC